MEEEEVHELEDRTKEREALTHTHKKIFSYLSIYLSMNRTLVQGHLSLICLSIYVYIDLSFFLSMYRTLGLKIYLPTYLPMYRYSTPLDPGS